MGRKILNCNIGDVFGCFEVLSKPYMLGEHSFVHVKCKVCGREQDLALSEIKNRPKQHCQYCRGEVRKLYKDPQVGEIYKNWEVIEGKCKKKGFWYFNCRCLKCDHTQYIRKDQILLTSKKCEGCKYRADVEKSKHKQHVSNRKMNRPYLTLFNHVCREAAIRSILVTITPEYLEELFEKQHHCCAITGDFLPDIRKASVDRIDSSKPYEKGNVQIVTKQANISKHVMTMEQLYEFCRKVLNHTNQQPSQPLTKLEGSETNS